MAVLTASRALSAVGAQAPANIPPTVTSGTSNQHGKRKVLIGCLAIVSVIALDAVLTATMHDKSYTPGAVKTPVQGLTIFATFFVAAAAIERLLEPLSGLLPSASATRADAQSAVATAGSKVAAASATAGTDTGAAAATAASNALTEGAQSIDNSSFTTYWKTVFLWGLATAIAMVASAGMKLYFLQTVGVASGPRWSQILATGLIVGSGTKPLHDLVSYIQAASNAKSS